METLIFPDSDLSLISFQICRACGTSPVGCTGLTQERCVRLSEYIRRCQVE